MHVHEITGVASDARYPSVTLLTSAIAGRDAQTTLRHLARHVGPRLEREFPPQVVAPLLDSVEQTIREVELDAQARAVAVFVNDAGGQWMSLPVAVRDRVVVDETFATRDVIRALLRARRYRVLTLGTTVQLYDGAGDLVTRSTASGFPAAIEEPAAPPAQRHQRRDRAEQKQRRLRLATRQIDAALDTVLPGDRVPLFVVGAPTRLSFFARSSRHRASIVASTAGRADTLEELGELVRPMIDSWFEAFEDDALAQIDAGRSKRLLASGVAEVWTLACAGRGDLLVVEEGFEFPAEVDPTTGYPTPAVDPTSPGVVDDLVDEIIEAVLGHRGQVAFVADGTLGQYERMALTLRY